MTNRKSNEVAAAAAQPIQADDPLTAALAAAARGWPVFPVRAGRKEPALHSRERCPRTGVCADGHQGWEQRATTDPDRIRAAWESARPGRPFNVGLATGPAGLLVVDLDMAKPDDDPIPAPWNQPGVTDGTDVFILLCEQHHDLTAWSTYTVATPTGGAHLYYAAPAGLELRNTQGTTGRGLGWKVDTRAHGGYVLTAGSRTAAGAYRVVDDRPPAPLPAWLCDALTPPPPPAPPVRPVSSGGRRDRYLTVAINAECARVIDAPRDGRNQALYVAAYALGQLVAGGALTGHEVTDALLHAAARHIALGAYSEAQARRTIASGLRSGANRPRKVAA
jgi:bifunctional DNA primase/polymerase-like protein